MGNFLFALIVAFAAFAPAQVFARGNSCVINFERSWHPITGHLVERSNEAETFIQNGMPLDIVSCAEKSDTVTVVLHAAPGKEPGSAVLVYFKAMSSQEKSKAISQFLVELEKAKKALYYDSKAPGAKGSKARRQLAQIEESLRVMRFFPADKDFYGAPKILLRQAFRKLLEKVRSPEGAAIKVFRISTCLTKAVRDSYPELQELESLGVRVEFAPENGFLSWFKGMPVTSLDPDWIFRR